MARPPGSGQARTSYQPSVVALGAEASKLTGSPERIAVRSASSKTLSTVSG
jgi:hypothetical protein